MVLKMARPILRGSFWYFRKKVPDNLQPLLKKTEEKFSLRTRDPTEAKIRFAKANAEIEERWRRLRLGVQTLSHKEAVAMAGEIYRRMIAEQEDNPSGLVFELQLDQYANGAAKIVSLGTNKHATAKAIERVMERRTARISARIDKFLLDEGHRIDEPSRAILQKHAEQAILKARTRTFKMSQGDYSPDPAAQSFPPYRSEKTAPSTSKTTLSVAIEEWGKEKTRKIGGKKKTRKKTAWVGSSARSNLLWASRFQELVGDKPLDEYTKADARAFKQGLMSLPPRYVGKKGFKGLSFADAVERAKSFTVEPMSNTNINKIMGFVSAFWEWAEGQYDEVRGNPFKKMQLDDNSDAREERLPFSTSELQKIFQAPLFVGCKSERSWNTPGNHIPFDKGIYWLPLIGLFTGARSGEIIQLMVDDIKEDGGILYFNITYEGKDQNTKTDSSVRTIPVHPMLKKLGFETYVAAQREIGERLFPDFPKAADGYYSTSYAPRFRRFLEKIHVKTELNTFHSFRHSFEDACLNSKIPAEFMNALQGHSDAGMAGRYGTGIIRLRLLDEEMQKLHYEGLDFRAMIRARAAATGA